VILIFVFITRSVVPQVHLINGQIELDPNSLQVSRSSTKYKPLKLVTATKRIYKKNNTVKITGPWKDIEIQQLYNVK
jgi:hypothetical protein